MTARHYFCINLFNLFGFPEFFYNRPEVAVENAFNIVPFFSYAVVSDSVLGKVVGPDFFRSVGCADLGVSLLAHFLNFLFYFESI